MAMSRHDKLLAEVRAYRKYLPEFFPVPHPSPRNRRWLAQNAWFERDVLPDLRQRFRTALGGML